MSVDGQSLNFLLKRICDGILSVAIWDAKADLSEEPLFSQELLAPGNHSRTEHTIDLSSMDLGGVKEIRVAFYQDCVREMSNDSVYLYDVKLSGKRFIAATRYANVTFSEVLIDVLAVDDGPRFSESIPSVSVAPGDGKIVDLTGYVVDPEFPLAKDCCTLVSASADVGIVSIGVENDKGMKLQYLAPEEHFEGATIRFSAKDGTGTVSEIDGILRVERQEDTQVVLTRTLGAGESTELVLPAPKALRAADDSMSQVTHIQDVVAAHITVDADGSALYSDLCAALASIEPEAVMDAIQEGRTTLEKGVVVLVRPGVYPLSEDCVVPPGVSVIGRSADATVLQGVLHVADLLPSTIRGLRFEPLPGQPEAFSGVFVTTYQWLKYFKSRRRGLRGTHRQLGDFEGNVRLIENIFCGGAQMKQTFKKIVSAKYKGRVVLHEYHDIAYTMYSEGGGDGFLMQDNEYLDACPNMAAESKDVGLYVRQGPRHCELKSGGQRLSTASVVAPGKSLMMKAAMTEGTSDSMVLMQANGNHFEKIKVMMKVDSAAKVENIDIETAKDTPYFIPMALEGYELIVPNEKSAKGGTVRVQEGGILYTPPEGYYEGQTVVGVHHFVDEDYVSYQNPWEIEYGGGSSDGDAIVTKGPGYIALEGRVSDPWGGHAMKAGPFTFTVDISDWTGKGALVLRMDTDFEVFAKVGGGASFSLSPRRQYRKSGRWNRLGPLRFLWGSRGDFEYYVIYKAPGVLPLAWTQRSVPSLP